MAVGASGGHAASRVKLSTRPRCASATRKSGKIAGHAEKLLSFFPSPGFCDEEMNFFLLTGLRDRRPG